MYAIVLFSRYGGLAWGLHLEKNGSDGRIPFPTANSQFARFRGSYVHWSKDDEKLLKVTRV